MLGKNTDMMMEVLYSGGGGGGGGGGLTRQASTLNVGSEIHRTEW